MLPVFRSLIVPAAFITLLPRLASEPGDIRGFTAESAKVERAWEAKFKAIPEPARMREALRRLAARPHHVGSPYGKANAEWLRDQFKSYGWDASIEEFSVLFPTPKERLLEMVAPTKFTARLDEPVLKEDPTSNQKSEQLPTYIAYSADGDVTGPLVYVNYGVPADYEELEKRGISVKGAIVIARYGGSWRGIKPKVAYEHGADRLPHLLRSARRRLRAGRGLSRRPVAPEGRRAARQRDGHADVSRRSAHAGRRRDDGREAPRHRRTPSPIMKIPVLPISYADAQPLLAAMTRTGRARSVARRPADHLPHGPGAGEGPPQAGVRLDPQAALRRHRHAPRHRPCPTSGWSAAITTTAG